MRLDGLFVRLSVARSSRFVSEPVACRKCLFFVVRVLKQELNGPTQPGQTSISKVAVVAVIVVVVALVAAMICAVHMARATDFNFDRR